MSYLIRKFSRPKWNVDNTTPDSVDKLSADAITSCLRTSSNTLSVWLVDSAEWGSFDDVLAALFSSFDRPDRADVVVIEKSDVDGIQGVNIVSSIGKTPASNEINQKHRDISDLKQSSLTNFADVLLQELKKDDNLEGCDSIRRFSRKDTINIVKRYVDSGQISADGLSEKWLENLNLKSSE